MALTHFQRLLQIRSKAKQAGSETPLIDLKLKELHRKNIERFERKKELITPTVKSNSNE